MGNIRWCKISIHMKQLIDHEAKERGVYKCEVCKSMLDSFFRSYSLNGEEKRYIEFLNTEYLLFMTKKYNGLVMNRIGYNVRLGDNYDKFTAIQKDYPNNKRLFELICFYYFNILPPELR